MQQAVQGFANNKGEPIWAPQDGSQNLFLKIDNHGECPVWELLLEGTRGGGKTDVLIMDFLQHVNVGWGGDWRGILFRQSFPQLADVIKKMRKWVPQIFPDAMYNKADHTWTFATGEELLLRHINDPEDYWNYHGHEYPWIGWEELTNWPTSDCYKRMMSCCRSSMDPSKRDKLGRVMPRKYRGTTNPYGPGHNWIKKRFQLPQMRGCIIKSVDGETIRPRMALHSSIYENKKLLIAEPDYLKTIKEAARNDAELAAWIHGSWDITSGGMFDDLLEATKHVIPDVAPTDIPSCWRITRAFDWGSSRPASVGWWAESDGSDLEFKDGSKMSTLKGDRIRLAEWYVCGKDINQGLKLTAEEIAIGIVEREIEMGLRDPKFPKRCKVKPGAADASIWDTNGGPSIAALMAQPVMVDGTTYVGVSFVPADKRSGSRKLGWEALRSYLRNAAPIDDKGNPIRREKPGLFIMKNCKKFIEIFPTLPRDEKDPDDLDTHTEDHCADEARYEIMTPKRTARTGSVSGNH